jgi:hypothetical protein
VSMKFPHFFLGFRCTSDVGFGRIRGASETLDGSRNGLKLLLPVCFCRRAFLLASCTSFFCSEQALAITSLFIQLVDLRFYDDLASHVMVNKFFGFKPSFAVFGHGSI